jgi:hypothetical protein
MSAQNRLCGQSIPSAPRNERYRRWIDAFGRSPLIAAGGSAMISTSVRMRKYACEGDERVSRPLDIEFHVH